MSIAVAKQVRGYEILARLKSGGMATLYLGRKSGASGFSRHVAIKFIHDHLAEDPDFVRMFVDEALVQARISHPNVVHVEELGEEDGKHFLVMEYVHGCALSQLLRALAKRNRALPTELAVYVAMQIAAGLHAAHELRDEAGQLLGVVHRDVSPDNVLLSYDGHVKLIDFGVAKVEARVAQTSAGLLKGKLRYMSPEQASGGAIDRRTDVYALGVVLWEMLTMHRLFGAADQLVLLETVRNPRIPPPGSLRADIPAALEAVVMKALAPDPALRYGSSHDFRRALAEAMPTAALTDAAQLGEVLGVVMASEIENDQRRLPAAASSVFARAPRLSIPPGLEEQALATRKISITGLGYLSENGASPPPPSPGGATLAPREPAYGSGAQALAAVPAPETGWPAVQASVVTAEASESRLPLGWIAAAVVTLAAIAAGTFFVVVRSPAPEPSVTQLPPLPPTTAPTLPAVAADLQLTTPPTATAGTPAPGSTAHTVSTGGTVDTAAGATGTGAMVADPGPAGATATTSTPTTREPAASETPGSGARTVGRGSRLGLERTRSGAPLTSEF
jgi:serine/threonine-protein kinase